jgi:hypothetical protein
MPARFLVARNPDEASTLPYLLRVPVAGPPLLLKAKDAWPRTAKVYCHRLAAWPDDAEVLEEVSDPASVEVAPSISCSTAAASIAPSSCS